MRWEEAFAALKSGQALDKEAFLALLTEELPARADLLKSAARQAAQKQFGRRIYIRGLIEFSNICQCDCYYCGIRKSNRNALRYRLTPEQVRACCHMGYRLGFRTFVLQGGEDPWFTDERLVPLIRSIKQSYPDCAVTLSLGERERASYQRLFDAGADRYLLRHETADADHYARLHPSGQTAQRRQACLWALKEIGYQTGTGFMVGSPGQTMDHLAEDLLFIQRLQPQMVGIGPFLPHRETPFAAEPPGKLELVLRLLSILRLMNPHLLLPATTALGTLLPGGREQGILAGANVVMPNLSPPGVRKKYSLYDHKISTGEEAAEGLEKLSASLRQIGYEIAIDPGNYREE